MPVRGRLRLAIRWTAMAAVVAQAVFIFLASPGSDAHAYWVASSADPYAHGTVDTADAYLYSPAFLQALTPLRLLSWEWFWAVWVSGSVGILVWLVGPQIAAIALLPTVYSPVFTEIWYGNIVMPIALVIALGLRYPALWSFMLLTKVTPGVGILWFAVRREWQQLAIAIGVTVAVIGVSVVLSPTSWLAWLGTLGANAAAPASIGAHLPGPEWRIPVAAAIVVLAARGGKPWALPPAILLALPVFWFASFSLLLVWIWQLRMAAKEREGSLVLTSMLRPNLRLARVVPVAARNRN